MQLRLCGHETVYVLTPRTAHSMKFSTHGADSAWICTTTNPDGAANARIEHDKALGRVLIELMKDDTELFRQYSDNDSFRKWLADSLFGMTYRKGICPQLDAAFSARSSCQESKLQILTVN